MAEIHAREEVPRKETLAEKVERLAQDIFDLSQWRREIADDHESHHIRISRVERETGLLS